MERKLCCIFSRYVSYKDSWKLVTTCSIQDETETTEATVDFTKGIGKAADYFVLFLLWRIKLRVLHQSISGDFLQTKISLRK